MTPPSPPLPALPQGPGVIECHFLQEEEEEEEEEEVEEEGAREGTAKGWRGGPLLRAGGGRKRRYAGGGRAWLPKLFWSPRRGARRRLDQRGRPALRGMPLQRWLLRGLH